MYPAFTIRNPNKSFKDMIKTKTFKVDVTLMFLVRIRTKQIFVKADTKPSTQPNIN